MTGTSAIRGEFGNGPGATAYDSKIYLMFNSSQRYVLLQDL